METTDIDQIKEMWNNINRRLDKLERQTIEVGRRVTSEKAHTAKYDLARQYKYFMIIGFIAGVLFPSWLLLSSSSLYPDTPLRYLSAALFFIYFMTAAVMDAYLYNEVKSINLAYMPVDQVIVRARELKKKHHIFMIILIPIAIVTLGMFAYPLLDETAVLAGMIFGGALGLAIGLRKYFQMMGDYREIMDHYS